MKFYAKMGKKNNIQDNKYKLIPIKLSAKDAVLLKRYCELNNFSPKIILKKIIRDFLVENVNMPDEEIKNQLSLWGRETDLFDFLKD